MLDVLGKRLGRYELTLHPTKTTLRGLAVQTPEWASPRDGGNHARHPRLRYNDNGQATILGASARRRTLYKFHPNLQATASSEENDVSQREYAPIAIFAYRRPKHLARTLDALQRCPEYASSPVFVFSDAAKHPEVASDVSSVRRLLQERRTPHMTIYEQEQNRGLANSIIAGVNELCERYGRVIVIEDDLLVHPQTLNWFNAALDHYSDDARIWQVSAHQFRVPAFRGRQKGLFLNLTTSWGWATWKRAWDRFDAHATGWEILKTDPSLRQRFDLGGAYPYADMLEQQMQGSIDSWAIRWWWTVFCASGLGLFPPQSLVANIGFDETATHSRFGWLKRFRAPRHEQASDTLISLPDEVVALSRDEKDVFRAIAFSSNPFRAFLRHLGGI